MGWVGEILLKSAEQVGGVTVVVTEVPGVEGNLMRQLIDQVRVKFSVNKGNRTVPHEVLAAPDEEFEVGEIVDLGKDRAVVHHIRTRIRTVHDGRVRADEIVRMYGRIVRERTSR